MNEISVEKLLLMNGSEINSLNYEGVVSVKGNNVIQYGKAIDTLDSDQKVSELWIELLENEGIY